MKESGEKVDFFVVVQFCFCFFSGMEQNRIFEINTTEKK